MSGGESFTPLARPPLTPSTGPSNEYQRPGPVNVDTELTPADLYGTGGAYYGTDALARGIRAGNPFAQAIRGATMYGEAAKFAPDPNYNPITDPAYADKPDRLIPVLAARSKQEADSINQQMDFWRQEQARLGNSGMAASIGEVVGTFLDPSVMVGWDNDLLGIAKLGGMSRFQAIRSELVKTVGAGVATSLPQQVAASTLDPLRPAGSFFDAMLATVGTTAVFGGMKGAMMAPGEFVGRLGYQNARVDPLIPGETGMELFHGSSQSFSYFDPGKRLSGGGDMLQGEGIYLSQSPHVAGVYQGVAGQVSTQGHLYRIAVDADQASFLDWQKQIGEQSPSIQKTLADTFNITPDKTGQEAYNAIANQLGSRKAAGEWLDAHGIPGTTYGDPAMTIDGAPARNFVVFDPKHLRVAEQASTPEAQSAMKAAQPGRGAATGGVVDFEQLVAAVKGMEDPGGDVMALSGKGAQGTMQVRRDTARDIARQMGETGVANMNDHQLRIFMAETVEGPSGTPWAGKTMTNSERYGRYYLQQQVDTFHNQTLALAAYNAGPGAVEDWLARYGDPRTGAIGEAEWIDKIPYAETKNYVKKINERAPSETGAARTAAADPTQPPMSERAAAPPKPGEGGKLFDLKTAVPLSKTGAPLSQFEKASSIRLPGETLPISDVTLLDAKGNAVAGAPLANGTPAIPHEVATLLDAMGNVTVDPGKAARVILPAETHPVTSFRFHDAEGRLTEGPATASSATLLTDPPGPPGLLERMAHLKNWMAEAADWITSVPLEGQRLGTPAQTIPLGQSEARAAGAQATPPEVAPGATTYAGAQAHYGEAMKSAGGLEKAPVNPILRLLNSPSLVARDLVTRLTQISGLQNKNLMGVASRIPVWTRLGLLRGEMNQALRFTDAAYVRYLQRVHGELGQAAPGLAKQWKTALRGGEGMMSRKQFFEAVGKAKRYGPEGHAGLPPEAIEAAGEWDKRVYKPIVDKADQSGAFTEPLRQELVAKAEVYKRLLARGQIDAAQALRADMADLAKGLAKQEAKPSTYKPDYLNRIYDQRALSARPEDFKRILMDPRYTNMTAEQAQGVLDTLQKAQPYQPFGPDAIGRAAGLHERTLAKIPDKALESFLEHDISIAGNAYTRQTGVDALMAEEFQGDINMGHSLDAVHQDYAAAIKANPEQAAKLTANMNADLRDIRALRDQVRGTYGLSKDPQGWMSRAIRLTRNFNNATQLTGFVSALPDLARIPMVHGINQSIGGLLQAFANDGKLYKLARGEARLVGESADLMTALNHGIFGHVSDSFAGTTRVEGLIQHIATARFAADGMAAFQDSLKSFASLVGGSQILQASRRLAAGTASAEEVAKLAAGYIDRPMAQRIADELARHGHDDGALSLANTELWTDEGAKGAFRASLNREINTTIAGEATPGERPLWMSKELGSLLSQYRTYGFSAYQRILLPGMQQRDRQFLAGVVGMVGMGMLTDMMLSQARGEDYDHKSWGLKLTNAVDRSGVLGWIMDANNAVEALSFGHVGVQSALGLAGRGNLERAAEAVGGPAVGTGANIFRAIGGNPADPKTHQAQMRLVPLYNIWQTRALFDLVASGNGQRGQGPTTSGAAP